ncbi:MAG TPA: MFS transporter [Opitutaceae bacterium]|jgi:MFS family permease|nr:MFS transporter [Opitutaceae bacterium]
MGSRSRVASPAYKWWVLGILWTICTLNYADRQAVSSVLPVLRARFGFSPEALGLIGSAFAWIYAAGSPLAGFLGDRCRRKRIIVWACVIWSVATALTATCRTLDSFVGVRALTGLGEMFYFPAAIGLLGAYHGPATRSKAFSLHQSGVYAGSILGMWGAGWWAQHRDWRGCFLVLGAAGIAAACLAGGGIAGAEPAPAAPARSTFWQDVAAAGRALASERAIALQMAAFFLINAVAVALLVWLPTFFYDRFHASLLAAALYSGLLLNLPSLLSVHAGGWLADALAARIGVGRLIVQVAGLLAGAVCLVRMGTATDTVTVMAAVGLFGLCKGLYDANIFASLFDVADRSQHSVMTGLMNTVGWLGGALGPLALSLMMVHGRHGADTAANMSEGIAALALLYLLGAGILIAAGRCYPERVR